MNIFRRIVGHGGLCCLGVVGFAAAAIGLSQSAVAQDKIVIGFVTHHHLDSFQERTWAGARAAAEDLGIELKLAAPDTVDAEAQIALVQSLVASGVDGVATTIISESIVPALNDIVEAGTPVVQFNLISDRMRGPFVGEGTIPTWTKFGKFIGEKIGGSGASGKVLIGNCFPGLEVLENRVAGTRAGVLSVAPNVEVLGPFDVKLAPTENYAAWESLARTHPDAIAMLDMCANGPANLGQIKEAEGYGWVAAGADATAENLKQVDKGNVYMLVGQSETLQGYMPVVMLVDAVKNGQTEIEAKFFDSGEEFITRDSVDQPYDLRDLPFADLVAMSQSEEDTIAFYRESLLNGALKDWKSLLQPIENQ